MSRNSKVSSRSSKVSSRSSHSAPSSFHIDVALANGEPLKSPADSGYRSARASSSVNVDVSLDAAYQRWKAADEASRSVEELDHSVEESRAQVKDAKDRLTELETHRKPLKRKKSIMTGILGKSKQNVSQIVDTTSSVDLADARSGVQEPERRLAELTAQLQATKVNAEKLDECFDILKNSLADGPLPSWRYIEGNEEAISRAEHSAAKIEATYIDSQKTTDAMLFAQNAVQSSHHHYSHAMFLLEGVCGSHRSKIAAIMADEQSKEMTYKEAAQWAQKAQICFNECLRTLEPFKDFLGDEAQGCDELVQTGLLQAVQLYNLNYGGKALQFGITTQMQIMLQKQEAVFERLTDFAVAVQNFTKHSESVHREMRHKRDAARRKLVALWMNDISDYSSPSSPISPL
ncbi:hypothetical protein BKA93DRAFT_251714 [Sparassis latifolia]